MKAMGASSGTRVGGGGVVRKPTVQPKKSETMLTDPGEDLILIPLSQ